MEFITYKRFVEEDHAKALVDLLIENNIEYELTQDRESLDSLYGDKVFNREFFIKLKVSDFPTVDELLKVHSEKQLDTVTPDHYLFQFSDEELREIVSRPDEWSEFDFLFAQRLLDRRGVRVDEVEINKLKQERIRELAKKTESSRSWIYLGYVVAAMGGPLGIIFGWHISSYKKTLPNGDRVYAFNRNDRTHGTFILFVGIGMLIFWIAYRVLKED